MRRLKRFSRHFHGASRWIVVVTSQKSDENGNVTSTTVTIQRRIIDQMLLSAALLCANVGPTLTSQRGRLVLTALAGRRWPCVWPKSMMVGPT